MKQYLVILLFVFYATYSTTTPHPFTTLAYTDPNPLISEDNAQCGWKYPVYNGSHAFCSKVPTDGLFGLDQKGLINKICFDLNPKRDTVQCWYHHVCGGQTRPISEQTCNQVQDVNGKILGCDWKDVNFLGITDKHNDVESSFICVKTNIDLMYNCLYVILLLIAFFGFLANRWRYKRENLFGRMYAPDDSFLKREKLRELLRKKMGSDASEEDIEERLNLMLKDPEASDPKDERNEREEVFEEMYKPDEEWEQKKKLREMMSEKGIQANEEEIALRLESFTSSRVQTSDKFLTDMQDEVTKHERKNRDELREAKLEFFERYIRIIEFRVRVDLPGLHDEEIALKEEKVLALSEQISEVDPGQQMKLEIKKEALENELAHARKQIKWNWFRNLAIYCRNYVPILSIFFGDQEHYLSAIESSTMLIFTLILSFYLNVGMQLDQERFTRNFIGTRLGWFGPYFSTVLCQVFYFIFYKIARMDEVSRLIYGKDDACRTAHWVIPAIFKTCALLACLVLYIFMLNLVSFLLNPMCYLLNVIFTGVLQAQLVCLIICILFFAIQWLNDEVYTGDNSCCLLSYVACVMFLGAAPVRLHEEQQQLLSAICDNDVALLIKHGIYRADNENIDDELSIELGNVQPQNALLVSPAKKIS